MSRYSTDTVERICELVKMDTYTDKEICDIVGVGLSTYYKWKAEKIEFREAIEKARGLRMDQMLVDAKRSLKKLINGFDVEEVRTVTVDTGQKTREGKSILKTKERVVTKKHYAPNTGAVIFMLTNGDPETWKNRRINEHTGKDGAELIPADLRRNMDDLQDDAVELIYGTKTTNRATKSS